MFFRTKLVSIELIRPSFRAWLFYVTGFDLRKVDENYYYYIDWFPLGLDHQGIGNKLSRLAGRKVSPLITVVRCDNWHLV